MKNKLLIIGDLHISSNLKYSDQIKDARKQEEKDVFDKIVESGKDCSSIVFLGDNLNSRNNSSEAIRKFTELIERFNGKEIYIISGNHELQNGSTAIDFLSEIKNPLWHIITNEVTAINNLTFCPYFTINSLECKTKEEGSKKLMSKLLKNDFLFVHHAISGSKVHDVPVSIFDEIVLNKVQLEKKYKKIFAGHIHSPSVMGNTIMCGSIFTAEINEIEKFIWKLDTETLEVEQIKLPVRAIYGLINPTIEELTKLSKDSIIKIKITEEKNKKELTGLKEKLEEFDANMIVEDIKTKRKKIYLEGDMIDFGIENMLEMYSKERKVDLSKLKYAFELIK